MHAVSKACLMWVAVASIGALSIGVSTPAVARSVVRTVTPARPIQPVVGSYDFTWPSGTGMLSIAADNTWSLGLGDYTDSGFWVSRNNSLALMVASSSASDTGCVLLGKVEQGGLNSKRHRGPFNCNGTAGNWYAIRSSDGARRSGRDLVNTTLGPTAGGAPDAAGHVGKFPEAYTAYYGSGPTPATLSVNRDHTWDAYFSGNGSDSGYWVSNGNVGAFASTSGETDQGCLYLGVKTPGAINSKKNPGPATCSSYDGSTFTWYAKLLQ